MGKTGQRRIRGLCVRCADAVQPTIMNTMITTTMITMITMITMTMIMNMVATITLP